MQFSPIFDSMWKTIRRRLNGPVGVAFAAALLVVITYQLVSKPANSNQPHADSARLSAPASEVVFADNTSPTDAGKRPEARARMQEAFGKMPLYFIENRGQMDERVAYYVQGQDKTVYFTAQGITYSLAGKETKPDLSHKTPDLQFQPATFKPKPEPVSSGQRWTVKLDFVDANPNVQPRGQDPTSAVISYFKGPREEWQTGLQTYSTVVYADLWPGIDLVYSGTANRLKYQFLVKPGADPQQIKLVYRGATSVKLNAAGELEVATPAGGFQDEQPVAYQDMEGQQVEVKAAFALGKNDGKRTQYYGFEVGAYDQRKPLVLDPAVLVYCGYIGGSNQDEARGIAVDAAGNAYVAGVTYSDQASFPVTVGPDLTFNGSYKDAFVAKVRADGTGLVYCGYIGGSGADEANGIAVDAAGNAYVAGTTNSDQASFPVTVGPDLTHNYGYNDAFVAKVRADGTGLVYCGYIGGAGEDGAFGIAVDAAGNAYVAGVTLSNHASFPVMVGPDLTFNGGGVDAFVAKVRANGTGLVYCGYIGGAGSNNFYANGIAVDAAGNAYIAGTTGADQASFPVTVGPDLTFNGYVDVFVAKVRADGTGLVYCGYIGGSDGDYAQGIAVDAAGNAYVVGYTFSDHATFPVTVGPDLTFNGYVDVFVAKVRADGTGLVYCGYIGGSGDDEVRGIAVAVDAAGNAYVAGFTQSDQASFPVTVGPDLTFNGGNYDAFVAKVRADGTGLVYCGYIGGSSNDSANGIAVDTVGNAYVAGWTVSDQASFPVTVGPDLTNGYYDAFVAKIRDTSVSTGAIFVTTNLSSATFRIEGPTAYSGGGTSFSINDAPAGTYTITYDAVPGYLAPPTATRTLSAGGAVAFVGSYTSRATSLFVNGNKLSGQELDHVLFVATSVLPQLLGGRTECILVASRASWWGLKEGTFSLGNPHVFSTCNRLEPNGKAKDVRLAPLEVCEIGRAWQVGLAAVQVPNFTEQQVLDVAQALWPSRPVATILAEAAQLAGFDPTQGTGAAIVGSTGRLRKSWLLRHPVVGLTLVERNVTAECIEGSRSWCYGAGWPQTRNYAPTREAALQSVADLATIFGGFSP